MTSLSETAAEPRRIIVERFKRDIRVYRYLRKAETPVGRNQVMHWTGFPSPQSQPICAFAAFENTIIRLNRRLRRTGWQIVREPNHEMYSLVQP